MSIRLDTLEQRIVGVLIEKALTVPDGYPLTLNSLISGCNQKSNRDPQMNVEDYAVEGALRALMDGDWVVRYERDGGHVMRYAHQAKEQLGVEVADLAILAELLCRGPQSPGELKTRASRMSPFASPTDVEDRLRDLAARPTPYVVELPRRPRERMKRWRHLLDGSSPEEALGAEAHAPVVTPTAPVVTPAIPTVAPTAPVIAATPTEETPSASPGETEELRERVDELEREVRDLTDRLDRLEGR